MQCIYFFSPQAPLEYLQQGVVSQTSNTDWASKKRERERECERANARDNRKRARDVGEGEKNEKDEG